MERQSKKNPIGGDNMKYVFAIILLSTLSVISVGTAHACMHDIMCPVNWVWSDSEGTCVEDRKGTS